MLIMASQILEVKRVSWCTGSIAVSGNVCLVCFVNENVSRGTACSGWEHYEMNEVSLTRGFVRQLFGPSSLEAGRCVGLSRKLHSWRRCHRVGFSAEPIVSTRRAFRSPPTSENLIASLDFHSFVKGFDGSNNVASSQALQICKRRTYMLHKRSVLRCGARIGKCHFTSNKWSKEWGLHLE